MATTRTARIANDSMFCEAHMAMDKLIEQLLAMADEGATADAVTQLIAKDGTALLRDLVQGYFDRRAEHERRVKESSEYRWARNYFSDIPALEERARALGLQIRRAKRW